MIYIDVSTHNGTIDWEEAKPHINGVMIRAGYGKGNIDAQFHRNISECNRLNIPVGVYWFSYAKTTKDAEAEAHFALNLIKDYKITLPIAYDLEYDTVRNAEKAGIIITKELASQMVRSFCDTILKDPHNYMVMNYANKDYLINYFEPDITEKYRLWFAQWPTIPNPSKPPRSCDIWQWGTSVIPGIKNPVDTNESYVDHAHLAPFVPNESKEEIEMTADELKVIIDESYNKFNPVYKTLQDVPEYWQDTVKELIEKEIIKGESESPTSNIEDTIINLSRDTVKAIVIASRLFNL